MSGASFGPDRRTTPENQPLNDDQVLGKLNEGGTLRYFYIEGGVALHNKNGEPDSGAKINITTFLGLRERGLIDTRGEADKVGGYPYYANNHKSQVYRITDKGREQLSKPTE